MRTYLVVANQTLGSRELLEHVQKVGAGGECEFHVIVPATPPKEHLFWTEGEARSLAKKRLDETLERWRAEGVEATGEVGDASPNLAVDDVMRTRKFDEVIVSTFPTGVSRWLKRSLPERIQRHYDLPVTHIVSEPEPADR
jgi:GABA permease